MSFLTAAASETTATTALQTTQTHLTFLWEKKELMDVVTIWRRPFHALSALSGRNALVYVNGLEALPDLIRTSPALSLLIVSDDPNEPVREAFASSFGVMKAKDRSQSTAFEAFFGGIYADANDAKNHKNKLVQSLAAQLKGPSGILLKSRLEKAAQNLGDVLADLVKSAPHLSVHYKGPSPHP